MIPPAKPSQVFFGLSHSISLCRPVAIPVKYAPMSVTFTTKTEYSSRIAPLSPPTSIRSRVKN
jgi:hypothetical protein